MFFRDLQPAPGVGPFQGLELEIEKPDLLPSAPGLRAEVTKPGRIRMTCGGAPFLWARIHPQYRGLWRLVAPREASWEVVPPQRFSDLSSIDATPGTEEWWKTHARNAARALAASPNSPLHAGSWILNAACASDLPCPPIPGPSPSDWSGLTNIHRAAEALSAPDLDWESWWTNGSGALLRMRKPSPPDAGRVKAWRKRARDGSLPPALVLFVTGLDMFLLLDGHDRLQAAMLEKAPIGFLCLWYVRKHDRRPDEARQAAILHEIERREKLAGGRQPLPVAQANKLLVDAFDDRPWVWPKTRAYPLEGGAAAWDAEVLSRGVAPNHRMFTGEEPPAS